MQLFAFGIGVGTKNRQSEWLEVFYQTPKLNPAWNDVAQLAEAVGYKGGNVACDVTDLSVLKNLGGAFAAYADAKRPVVATFLATDATMVSIPESYLKLHLLSHRLVKPRGVDLGGLFKIMPNVAWTNRGAIDVAELDALRLECRLKGEVLEVNMVDKLPRMTDYVVPSGIRIADTARVRLGAYVGSGTTVMQEGFINFNAGTEGPNMIEGRVSSSVWIGAGTDLGGGSSTMGILSGGGTVPISIGKSCLIGANAGVGIPLGDDCTVESGLYLTAASKVRILNAERKLVKTMKAKDLQGRSNLLFWRNSLDGAIECMPNKAAIQLNNDLHVNQ